MTEVITVDIIPAYLESNQLIFELESVGVYDSILYPTFAEEYKLKPQVEVKYDLEIERNTQKSVDQGHSPWRLDPIATTQVFVSLQLSPSGIEGEYPIELKALKLLHSSNEIAIVGVNDSDTTIKTVYLKRLNRQNVSGIWTVVGYDTISN